MSSIAGRTVLLTGATGVTGRAVAAALVAAGAIVIAVGTDATRLESVDARGRFVADLADAASVERLAGEVTASHPVVDGIVHLVGGWRGGDDPETRAWLDARLVTSLENVVAAFAGALAGSDAARLAIVGSSAVTAALRSGDKEPGSAYAAAKLAAERIVGRVADGWSGTDAAAVTWVVRSLGDGSDDTTPATVADAALALWDAPASELNGTRIRL